MVRRLARQAGARKGLARTGASWRLQPPCPDQTRHTTRHRINLLTRLHSATPPAKWTRPNKMAALAAKRVPTAQIAPPFDFDLATVDNGKRELLTLERTKAVFEQAYAQALASSGRDRATLRSIRLSTKSFDVESARWAASELQKMPALVVADLSDIIAGRETSIGLAVLNTMCMALTSQTGIRRLDLSENALGERGVRTLTEPVRFCFSHASMRCACVCVVGGKLPLAEKLTLRPLPLRNHNPHPQLRLMYANSLDEVLFCNDGLSALSVELIRDIFLPAGADKGETRLRALHFFNNMSGDGGGVACAGKFLPISLSLFLSVCFSLLNRSPCVFLFILRHCVYVCVCMCVSLSLTRTHTSPLSSLPSPQHNTTHNRNKQT